MLNAKPRFPFDSLSAFHIKLTRLSSILVVALLLLSASDHSTAQQKKRETQPAKTESATITPEEAVKLEAVVTTELGAFRFEFFPDKAPKHVQQFIKLARSGYYD